MNKVTDRQTQSKEDDWRQSSGVGAGGWEVSGNKIQQENRERFDQRRGSQWVGRASKTVEIVVILEHSGEIK